MAAGVLAPPRSGAEASRWFTAHRRAVAGVLAALAVVTGLAALRTPSGSLVVAAARALPSGRVLRPTDLELVRLPGGAVPSGALREAAQAVGRALAGPVTAGEPLTMARLGLLPTLPTGELALPVRPSDPDALAWTAPGSLVALLAGPGDAATAAVPLVAAATVLALPGDGSVVVAVSPGQAASLAALPSVLVAAVGTG